jgi:hypothetical protein
MQQLIPLVCDLADLFDRLALKFAVGGAIANNFWGTVRTTQDVDCLVAIPALRYQELADELQAAGFQMLDGSQCFTSPTVEQMRAQANERKLIECYRGSIRTELFAICRPYHNCH